jgi:hypothetical protein
MTLRKATLIRLTTLDGWAVLEGDVPLGRQYLVDLDSVKEMLHAELDKHPSQ